MGLNERFAIYFEGVRDAVVSKWRVRPELTCSLVWGLLAVLGGFIVQLTLGSFYRYRKTESSFLVSNRNAKVAILSSRVIRKRDVRYIVAP